MRRMDTLSGPELHGLDIVCFSNDWTGDPLSKTHLMRRLARHNRVLWVDSIGNRKPRVSAYDAKRAWNKLAAAANGLREVEPNLFVLSPFALPYYGRGLPRAFNRVALRAQVGRAMRRLGMRSPISWSFLPSAATVAGTLGESLVVYHAVDEFSAFAGTPAEDILELERLIASRSHLVIVSSERLLEAKRPLHRNTVLVRHGVDVEHFRRALDPATPRPPELAERPGPVIGFFGLIAEWIDLELLHRTALAYPKATLALVGARTVELGALAHLPNVLIAGRRPYAELPSWCRAFDVALNPFAINALTLAANPLKVREYLAAGLPVVSTAIPEVARLGACRIARSKDEFVTLVGDALADTTPRTVRSLSVEGESWDARLSEIAAHVWTTQAARRNQP